MPKPLNYEDLLQSFEKNNGKPAGEDVMGIFYTVSKSSEQGWFAFKAPSKRIGKQIVDVLNDLGCVCEDPRECSELVEFGTNDHDSRYEIVYSYNCRVPMGFFELLFSSLR